MIDVRFLQDWENGDAPPGDGDIAVFLRSEFSPDAMLTVEQLVELRAAIDRFLFLDWPKRAAEDA